MPGYAEIIAKFEEQQEATRAANEARYAESLKLYDEVIEQYQPEGGFLKGAEAELGREKVRTVAEQEQKLVSSGLFGTSIRAGLGSKWEAEVGQPARLKLEDVRMGRLAQALGGKAGAIERREDVGPDYALIAQLVSEAAKRPTGTPSGALGGGGVSGGGGGGGQLSTRPGSSTSLGSTGGLGGAMRGSYGEGGSSSRGTGGATPQFRYVKGPSLQSKEGMAMSREGATYMGGGDWRYAGDLAAAHAAAKGYPTPEEYVSPWGLPSPYAPVGETIKKYSYNPYA